MPVVQYKNSDGTYQEVDATHPLPSGDAIGTGSVASTRVSVLVTATTLVAARTGRRRVLAKNIDTVNPIYIGPATVTVANGMEVKAGESVAFYTAAALQAIASGGTCAVCVIEEY